MPPRFHFSSPISPGKYSHTCTKNLLQTNFDKEKRWKVKIHGKGDSYLDCIKSIFWTAIEKVQKNKVGLCPDM